MLDGKRAIGCIFVRWTCTDIRTRVLPTQHEHRRQCMWVAGWYVAFDRRRRLLPRDGLILVALATHIQRQTQDDRRTDQHHDRGTQREADQDPLLGR